MRTTSNRIQETSEIYAEGGAGESPQAGSRPRDLVERDALLGEAYGRTNDFESADEHHDLIASVAIASSGVICSRIIPNAHERRWN